jgi:hypothetical protein
VDDEEEDAGGDEWAGRNKEVKQAPSSLVAQLLRVGGLLEGHQGPDLRARVAGMLEKERQVE